MSRWARGLWFGLAAAPYAILAGLPSDKPTFALDVKPVLQAHCASCHSGPSASAGLDLTTVAGIKKVIIARNAGKSSLVLRMQGIGGAQMPMGFAPLPKAVIDRIGEWIANG